ncbi:MAG: sigma-70 family RNA polymerase sigma factor [Candidatus Poribacteria bacterium]|nr:sigma-70 family RNA polymerase sigma factor [Candidatus Poribacteria bacterium]
MKNRDLELIQRVLAGDEMAFTDLVKKYQKPVHALVWRKIGDFHIAEEITQDTFLKAYQKLGTLKKPQHFASWLYVIATRRCLAWQRKKRLQMQPMDETSSSYYEKATYSQHIVEENERTAVEAQREVVKRLLAKLPESERTVITLYYFSEMSSAEIGAFLGVSANTIRSRLRRAQQRLQKEETMIREALDHFQISPHLTDNIMREVGKLNPYIPSTSKPLVPWMIGTLSGILIVLMFGISNQHLVRFQQPYSLDAQAEMSVELVDAPVVQNVDAERHVRREIGRADALGVSDNNGQRPDEVLLAAAEEEGENEASVPKQQWIQSKPLTGTMIKGLLATTDEELYALTDQRNDQRNLYKLQDDREEWKYVSDISSITDVPYVEIPMAKWDNTLYMLPSHKLYASNDDGKTWDLVHQFPEEYTSPKELLLMKHAFYIVFERGGAFRSEDEGKTWMNINDEFPTEPNSIVAVQDTVFTLAGSIYRWDSDSWKRLAEFPVPEARNCYSITATDNQLYAFVKNHSYDPENSSETLQRGWWIFRSTDLGNSWKDITPTHVWKSRAGWLVDIRIVAAGDTLMAIEQGMVRSADAGDTWMPLQGFSPPMFSNSPDAVVSDHVFYFGSWDYGLQRSTDGGKSWDAVNFTPDNSRIGNIIVSNKDDKGQNTHPIIYGNVGEMVKTTDKGKSWNVIPIDVPMTSYRKEQPTDISQIVKSDGVIYAKGSSLSSSYSSVPGSGETRVFRVATDGNKLVPIQDMPLFDSTKLYDLLNLGHASRGSDKYYTEMLRKSSTGATQFFKQLAKMDIPHSETYYRYGVQGAFAVSDNTFYMEYNFKLLRWEPGDTEWHGTGQEETVDLTMDIAKISLKLAVSGDTVYVGKRDGHLVVSFDKGNNWFDITPGLPFAVKAFNEIVVAGSTVYVATDAGIITSDDGRNWRTVTDTEGTNLIMEHLSIDGTTLYGVNNNTGIYRLEKGVWEQVLSDAPDNVNSFAVDGNSLYVGTQDRAMLHFNLEE